MKKGLFFLFFLFFTACINKKLAPAEAEVDKQINSSFIFDEEMNFSDGRFRIIFEAIFEKNDLFLLYFSDNPYDSYNPEKSISKKIVGSPISQRIIIVFDEGVRPYDLRIDFSDYKDQGPIILGSITFVDNYNKVKVDSRNIENYFDFNTFMQYDKEKNVLFGETHKIDGKEGYNPYFIANQSFKQVLNNFNSASILKQTKSLIEDITNIKPNDNRPQIIFKGIFESDDWIQLYYAANSLEAFDESKVIDVKVRGSNEEQTIFFILPRNESVAKLKLDISDNKNQKNITIKTICFAFEKDRLNINKSEFLDYFLPNNYIDYNKKTDTFKCKIIKTNGLDNYNPYFISSVKLMEKLAYFY